MDHGTVTLYLNGAVVTQSQMFSQTPASLGLSTQNWIGRSQSASDPYLVATLDELRVYGHALSPTDVFLEARLQPFVWYPFDDATGTTASDGTGGGHDATLVGSASWGTGRTGGAVVLDGQTGYVELPAAILESATEATIGGWVYVNNLVPNARFFDFGSGTNQYMYVAPANGYSELEFSMTTNGFGAAAFARAPSPPAGAWQFMMVTLGSGTSQLYLNGSPVGSPSTIPSNPSGLGWTSGDRIGKSQYSTDPLLTGSLDDFFIYTRSLSASEILVLAR